MAPRQIKALELAYIAMVQFENLVLLLGSKQEYSRHECMSLSYAQLRVKIGTIKIGISTFCQTVQLQSKHLANTRSPQNWSRTAINPSYNWRNITNLYRIHPVAYIVE
jgi:hypothetical protein